MSNFENTINSILLEWAANSDDGIPTLDDSGIQSLYESLIYNGIKQEEAYNIASIIAEKGKYPERQAYNKNGLLVTFPTPEYKARAIAKGTHFEKNPKISQSNLFGGGQQAPNQPTPQADPQQPAPSSDGSSLPPSDSGKPESNADQPTSPTPASSPAPSSAPSALQTPAQGQLATEPIAQDPSTPPNVAAVPEPKPVPAIKKTPQEITAEKEIIKQMLDTGDTIPTVPGVGGVAVAEQQLKKLMKIALEMELNEAVKVLSKLI
jgi:hypothetical protein